MICKHYSHIVFVIAQNLLATMISKQCLFQDSDIQISKSMRRSDSMYQMDVEVTALFIDLHKCQNVSNLLVEKLDPTVTVCLPEFFHSSVTLQNLRFESTAL